MRHPGLLPVTLALVFTIGCGALSSILYGSTSEYVIITVTVTGTGSSSSSDSSSSSASVSSAPVASSSQSSINEPGGRRPRPSSSSEPSHGAACDTPFEDIPSNIWYADELYELVSDGIIDCNRRFRPHAFAVRAEYAKVIVKTKGIIPDPPVYPSYDDALIGEWYYPYVEEASVHTWMRGYGDCYGTRPCFVKPESLATRAEAAAMILRSYNYEKLDLAPAFSDVESYAWYKDVIQAAADRCILQGDDETGLVSPNRPVNRAEMVVLFSRARQGLRYGLDCGVVTHEAAPISHIPFFPMEASKWSNNAILSLIKSLMVLMAF